MLAVNDNRIRRAEDAKLCPQSRWRHPLDVLPNLRNPRAGVLVRYGPYAELRDCAWRNHGLQPAPGVAAGDAVQCNRGTDRHALVMAEAWLAPTLLHSGIVQNVLVCRARMCHVFAFLIAPVADVIVKARHGNAAFGVIQARQHLAQTVQWVRHRAAEVSGMQFVVRAAEFQLKANRPALRVADRRPIGRNHARVGDDPVIGCECAVVALYESLQVRASLLLIAFKDAFEVYGQPTIGLHQRFDRLYVYE